MEFQLPQNLLKQVVAYDPVLKPIYQKIEQANKPGRASSGPRLSLGVIDCLVPTDLVAAAVQLQITTDMNAADATQRAIIDENDKVVFAIVYHLSNWYCWWHLKPSYLLANPDVAKLHNYVYGFSTAFKNTAASLDKHDTTDFTLGWREEPKAGHAHTTHAFSDYCVRSEVKTAKSKSILKTMRVTEDMVLAGCTLIPLREKMNSYSRSMQWKRKITYDWFDSLKNTISTWKDEPLFDRIREAGDVRKCVFGVDSVKGDKAEISFIDLLIEKSLWSRTNLELNDKVREILNTPYFRKLANKAFDTTLAIYSDTDTEKRSAVQRPYRLFSHNTAILSSFLSIYDNATLDHCQQLWAIAPHIQDIRVPAFDGVKTWLRENMPVASYLQIIAKKIEEDPDLHNERYFDFRTGAKFVSLFDLNDSIAMLDQLHKAQHHYDGSQPLKLDRPSRWRITEFHDYLAAECFKISTPNEKLPQDFFPEPVRIEKDGQKWSFFQPCDVHQLGSWGKAVRNCVGSADSYRKGIKSKTHFIFLVMLDNQPRYTVQAKLRNGTLTVEQIADVCNKSLSTDQKELYSEVFAQAIDILKAQLPAVEESTDLELAAQ